MILHCLLDILYLLQTVYRVDNIRYININIRAGSYTVIKVTGLLTLFLLFSIECTARSLNVKKSFLIVLLTNIN